MDRKLTKNNMISLERTFVGVPDSHKKAVQHVLSNMILDIQEDSISKEELINLLCRLEAVTGFNTVERIKK